MSRSRRETRRLAVGWVCAGGRRLQAAGLNPFRFSTKRTDPTTDLVLYEYRAYSPSLGLWLSVNPIAEHEQVGLYSSVRNNPVGSIAPSGETLLLPDWEYKPIWPAYDPRTRCWRGEDGRFSCPPPRPVECRPVARLCPQPMVPPAGNSAGCQSPASGAADLLSWFAAVCNDFLNAREVQDGLRACRAQAGGRFVQVGCCVLGFCVHHGCFGRVTVTRVMARLDLQPCARSEQEWLEPVPKLYPGCPRGEEFLLAFSRFVL